jgi:LPS-assembly protein
VDSQHARRRRDRRLPRAPRRGLGRATGVLAAALSAALALAGSPAAGQEAPPTASAPAGDGALRMTADRTDCDETLCRWTGDVRVYYQDIVVSADEVVYNRGTMDLWATGRVVVDRGPSRFTAEEASFNLRDKTGLFVEATGFLSPMYTFSGRTIEKLDETRYRVDRAIFTTCEVTDRHPPWSLHLHRALLEEEGYGRFTSAAIKIQGVPVFYLPYMVWPIKRDRAPGLLMPTFGYSDRLGTSVGLPIYVPFGRSWDTTFHLDYYAAGFWGLGNELRWAPVQDAVGQLDVYNVYNEAEGEWQWRVKGRHDQADVLGFRLQAQLENLSDSDFWQEFDRSFEANTRRDVYSFGFMTRSWGPYSLNLLGDHRRTFFSFTDPDLPPGDPDRITTYDTVLARVPEVELRVRSTRLGRSELYWNLISSVNLFSIDKRTPKQVRDGTGLVGTYGRADVFPTLNYTLPGPPWLTVTPRLGGRYTYYSARYSEPTVPATPTAFVEEPIDRYFIAGGVDIGGPSISRVFTTPRWGFSKFKHLIEPRIEYAYLQGTEDTSQIPVFDEVDSTPLDNRVRVSLANRLFGRSEASLSSRELASFELFQDYSFSRPLSFGLGGETSGWGLLTASLRLTPTLGASFDARASYDTFNSNLASTSLSATGRRPYGSLALTWYAGHNPLTGDRVSSQVRTLISFRKPNFPLSAQVHVAYDLEQAELQQQRFVLGWVGSCWSISAEYRDLKLGLFPTRDFRIVIELKGIGSLPEIKGSLGGG